VRKLLKLAFICAGAAAIVFVALHSRDLLRVASRPHIKWEHKGLHGFYDRVTIGLEGNIYVLTVESLTQRFLLEALDHNGAVQWSREDILSAPAIDSEGRLYVNGFVPQAREKVFLEALDAAGHSLWKWWLPQGEAVGLTAPAIGLNGKLFIGGRCVRAFDRDGHLLWTFGQASDRFVYGRPLINADKRVYVLRTRGIDSTDESGHLLVLNEEGVQLSDVDVFNRYASVLPIGFEHVAAVGMDLPIGTNTYTPGLDISWDGSSVRMDHDLARVRMIGEKHWYLVASNQDMTVVEPRGKRLCTNTGSDHFEEWTLAADGTVYAGGNDLISISPSCWNGWRLNLRSPVSSIVLGTDGTIYALTQDGALHAITETILSGGAARSMWPGDNHDSRNTNSVLQTQ